MTARKALILLMASALFVCAPLSRAFAGCTSPTAGETGTNYDFTAHILRYCDGTNWINLGGNTGAASVGAAGTVQFAGTTAGTFNGDATNLFWDNTNKRLGIGTAAPATNLDIESDTLTGRGLTLGFHNTSIAGSFLNIQRSRGTAASPTALANGDYGNAIAFTHHDGTSYLSNDYIGTYINGTVSAGSVPADIIFSTSTANDNNPVANGHVRMVITSAGNVGIGTTSPAQALQVGGANYAAISSSGNLTFGGTGVYSVASNSYAFNSVSYPLAGLYFNLTQAGYQFLNTSGTSVMHVGVGGNVGIGTTSPGYKLEVAGQVAGNAAYVNTSDVRLKKDIEAIPYGLAQVEALRPVSFQWKVQQEDWQKGRKIGLIAQEVEKVVPEAVVTAKDEIGTKSIGYGDLVPVLIKAVQELKADNDNQDSEIRELRENISALKSAAH